jgi:hypothetical protein
MRRGLAALALALAGWGAVACAPDNSLSGSLGEVFPLDVSRVEVARNDEALQVTYYFNRGVFLDVVARVSVLMSDVSVVMNAPVPLQGEGDGGVLRCVVTHAPGGEPVRTLPHIKRGDLTLTHGGHAGELTAGSFSMSFEAEGGDLGFGRTLGGTFSATASDAGFGALP